MVAPSYQSFDILSDPFTVNNKQYVRVRNPKTGTERQVRFYEPAEFRKAFPSAETNSKESAFTDPYYKPQKVVLGFLPPNETITIFRGETESHIEWLRANKARYTRWWGWYFSEPPTDIPKGLEPVSLPWNAVAKDSDNLKPDSQLAAIIDSILYPITEQMPEISLGDRKEFLLTIKKVINLETAYGSNFMYIMEDDTTQQYVWTTSARSWTPNSTHHIRGTIKDIQTYQGKHQIVLTRCAEIQTSAP